jgi:colanic acid/amylovoran biosynthesis glycosyltransferase
MAINTIQPDILHFQWVSVLSYLKNLKLPKHTKTILSQRGFHINVRPFVNPENMLYLNNWYPKINGFHSVSCAIKKVSNKIYTSTNKVDHVVYSGLYFSKFPFSPLNIENTKQINILSVGRDHWKKGYVYAIRAMAILKEKNIQFHYTIIGAKKSEELLYYIKEYKLEQNVSIIGGVSQSRVYELMRLNNLLLLPSLEEGIANVCIEAMALGTPVISTDCGGMKELITSNQTGFIVPICCPESIAEKVVLFKNMNLATINKLTNNARLKVETQHNELKMIADMKLLYKEVIKRV